MPRVDQLKQQSPATVEALKDVVGTALTGLPAKLSLPQATRRPLMTFIDDDGGLPTLDEFLPVLAAKGVPGCAAIVIEHISPSAENRVTVGGTPMMTMAEIQQLQEAGWEIASHSYSHANLTEAAPEDVTYELAESQLVLKANGFAADVFVYPFSANNAAVRAEARKYYKACFGNTADFNTPPLATYQIRRKVIDNLSAAQMIAAIDAAIAENAWLVWSCHTYRGDYDEQFWTDLGEALDYAAANGVDVVTPSQGLAIFGNLLEQGDPEDGKGHIRVSCEGAADTTAVISTVIDSSQPITAFPMGESIMQFSSSAGNYPTNIGTVLTHRTGLGRGSDYQIVTTRNSGQVWRRCWDETTSAWRPFLDTKQGLPTVSVSLNFGNFTAGQVKTAYVDYPGVENGDIAIGQPQNGYPGQFIWSVSCTNDGRIEVRLMNASSDEVSSGTRTWWLSAIKRF